jgi:hypothetical protein
VRARLLVDLALADHGAGRACERSDAIPHDGSTSRSQRATFYRIIRLASLVLDPRFEGISGRYFVGDRQERSSVESYDEARAAALWEVSLELTGGGL